MGYRKRVTGAGLREGVTGRVLREQGYGKGLQEEGLQEAKRVAGRGCVSGVTHATRSRNPFLVVHGLKYRAYVQQATELSVGKTWFTSPARYSSSYTY